MKTILIALLLTITTIVANAQMTAMPSGGNKRASVYEQVGLCDITIKYNRPHVNGREGQIWGKLVPVGYVDQGFGPSKASPWRAGANENTVITFSTDIRIEGHTLPAGRYGFFIAYDPNECTLIFSKNSTSWGSFFYNQAEDVLRVKVKPIAANKSVEWLRYEFTNQTDDTATIQLEWEKLIIPFNVQVDVVGNQLALFRNELRSEKGFTWQTWDQAAYYCAQHKVNLEQALAWTDTATSENFGGSRNFVAWRNRAMVLDSLGRSNEAIAAMKKGLPYGSVTDLYVYARGLSKTSHKKEAFDAFKLAYDRFPDQFFSNAGMARGYSAIGEYKRALPYAQKALAQAPNQPNKDILNKIIATLKEGKDIN